MSDESNQRWSVRVLAAGKDGATIYARKSRLELGPALAFDPSDGRPSAFELLLGALGAELVGGLKRRCRRQRLEVDRIEAVIEGEVAETLAYLDVVGEEGTPKIASLALKVYLETFEEEAVIRALWQQCLARSPLYQTLIASVRCELVLQLVL